jgi:hypothetical protein
MCGEMLLNSYRFRDYIIHYQLFIFSISLISNIPRRSSVIDSFNCTTNFTRPPHLSVERRVRYRKAQQYLHPGCDQREPRMYRISMDTVLFLETIVHFHSYMHYTHLSKGRCKVTLGKPAHRQAQPTETFNILSCLCQYSHKLHH